MGETVADVATTLGVLSGKGAGAYTSGLVGGALSARKIAVVAGAAAPYPEAIGRLEGLGASTTVVTPGSGTAAPSVIPYEFHKDLDAFLAAAPGVGPSRWPR